MRAIVTGAASGMGRATALRLARDSRMRDGAAARILLVDIAAGPLDDVAAELRGERAEAHVCVGDLGDPAIPARVVAEAGRLLGGLDLLVSNAGILGASPLADIKIEEYDRVLAVNTRAALLLAQAALPLLKASRGCIIATASISSTEPTPLLGAYSTSKAALVMLIRQMAMEWGEYGIRCNCIAPGATRTPMTEEVYRDAKRLAARAAQIPLGRVGAAEDMAAAISFLAGPDAAYITGITMPVDGGLLTTLMSSQRKLSSGG